MSRLAAARSDSACHSAMSSSCLSVRPWQDPPFSILFSPKIFLQCNTNLVFFLILGPVGVQFHSARLQNRNVLEEHFAVSCALTNSTAFLTSARSDENARPHPTPRIRDNLSPFQPQPSSSHAAAQDQALDCFV